MPPTTTAVRGDRFAFLAYRGFVTTKKKDGAHDQRRDPEIEDTGAAMNHRVDRVFSPTPARSRPRETAQTVASALLASKRSAAPQEGGDSEVALRRQLSRLQRQLSEAQLELSRKDEELAAEIEKRIAASTEHAEILEDYRSLTAHAEALDEYPARLASTEQRLLDLLATVEELTHERDDARGLRAAEVERIVELTAALDEGQARWKAERAALEQAHTDERALHQAQKKTATDQSEEAIQATTARLRETYEEQLTQLRESHERSLAAVRGDVEPQLLAARNLASDNERLTNELAAVRATAAREAAERDEAHKRELGQIVESHMAEMATLTRDHMVELTRAVEDRDAKALALEQATQAAEQRDKAAEETAAGLREAKKKLMLETAEAKELHARLELDKAAADERLVASGAALERLVEEKELLRDRLDASEAQAQRHEQERRRFVAYLEEGLALVGALPADTEPETTVTIEAD